MSQATQPIDLLQWALSLAIPAGAGLAGVLIGAWLSTRRVREQARLDFYARQLREFYSPLVGIRREIRVLSEFRVEVNEAANTVWQELCRIAQIRDDPDGMEKVLEPERKFLSSRIEYNNRQLVDHLIPGYQRMLDHFRDNYWLAEPETRQYFPTLVRFVEFWNRFLSESHSPEVLQRIDINEGDLKSFYEHLEKTHDVLRQKLKSGKA